ncbi:hypothetical protein [Actinomadura geliboluensis]
MTGTTETGPETGTATATGMDGDSAVYLYGVARHRHAGEPDDAGAVRQVPHA